MNPGDNSAETRNIFPSQLMGKEEAIIAVFSIMHGWLFYCIW
jgi:hypothetical protein